MSVINRQLFAPQQLSTAIATFYTVPTNRTAVVVRATFINVSAGAETVTVHLVPSGGSPLDSNKIMDAFPLDAGETFSSPDLEGQVLPEQSTIQMLSSANTAINAIFSGLEIT